MHKRLKWMLPIVQVAISSVLLLVGTFQHPLGSTEYKYGSAAVRICMGLNAPALVFRFAALSSLQTLGVRTTDTRVDNACFLLGIGLLWYLVGLQVETARRREPPRGVYGTVRVVAYLFFFVVGIGLLPTAIQMWSRIHWYSMTAACVEGSLEIAWGLVLVFCCGRGLLRYAFSMGHFA